jgi:hypothetical protein
VSATVDRRPLLALAAVAALAAAAPASRADELRPVDLQTLRAGIVTPGQLAATPRGLELQVEGNTHLELPLRAQVLELDVEASGPVLLTWAARSSGQDFKAFGPPWRHLTLPRRRSPVTLDLRIASGWTPGAQIILVLTGTGRVVIHGVRTLPVGHDPEASRAAVDRANLWAPESIGHTTINLLTTPYWSLTRRVPLANVIAGAAALLALGALGAVALRRRVARPELALAAGALFALGAWDLNFLVRFLPMLHLAPTPDVEVRIRDHYDVAPEIGALAALARQTLRPDERVGAMGPPVGWFGPQTICFNLAPRPCVIVRPGEAVHAGISGVGRLADDELDAIVAHRVPLPPGFVPVASLGPSAVVARRVAR